MTSPWRIQVSAPVRTLPDTDLPEPEDSAFVGKDERGDQEQRRKRAARRRPVRGRPATRGASRRPSSRASRQPGGADGSIAQQVPS